MRNPRDYYWFGHEDDNKDFYDLIFRAYFSPGSTHLHSIYQGIGYKENFSWSNIYEIAKAWIDNLVDEIHAIESIARINMIPSFFSELRPSGDFNANYSGLHGTEIKKKIGLLKERIHEEIPLSNYQADIINHKLDELIDKVDKLNKFDFRTLFFGILTNIASSVIYDSAPVFWNIVSNIFSKSFFLGGSSTELLV